MLPEIVKAAAEPIGRIESLTVLSTEGASDVVKTATRTLSEASASVKSLTGIDIPQLLNDALGTETEPEPPKRKRGDDGSGGSGGSGGPGGSGGSKPPAPSAGTPSSGTEPAPGTGSGGSATSASAAVQPSSPAATMPAAETASREPTPEERFAAAAKAMERTTKAATPPAADALGGLSSPLPPMPPVSDLAPGDKRRLAGAALGTVGLDESSTLSQSAQRLAEELIRIPGIERFGGTRLRDLDRSGPRSLRVLWGAARDELSSRYGDVTIGMLLDAYGRQRQDGANR
jgi:hypothetical protein